MKHRFIKHGPLTKKIISFSATLIDFYGTIQEELNILAHESITPVQIKIFSNNNNLNKIMESWDQNLRSLSTFIGSYEDKLETCSALIIAVQEDSNTSITQDENSITVNSKNITELYLSNISNPELFTKTDEILSEHNMSFTDVVRTWFFIPNIISNYSDLNKARDRYFKIHNLYNYLPASTGIDGYGTSKQIFLDLVATTGSNIKKIPIYQSTAQGDARSYGSLFSRALIHQYDNDYIFYTSGTASISTSGLTVHLNDINAQIEETFRCIEALLNQKDLQWSDTIYAIVYCKNLEVYNVWQNFKLSHCSALKEAITTIAHVCRDDLLFEVEVLSAPQHLIQKK